MLTHCTLQLSRCLNELRPMSCFSKCCGQTVIARMAQVLMHTNQHGLFPGGQSSESTVLLMCIDLSAGEPGLSEFTGCDPDGWAS